MTKKTFRVFVIITGFSLLGLISLQLFWLISSFQNDKISYERLIKYAVRQIDGRILNFFSPDYFLKEIASSNNDRPPEFTVDIATRPVAASKFLGYYHLGKDSLPVFGPKYVRDRISIDQVDSLIRDVLAELKIPGSCHFGVFNARSNSYLYGNQSGFLFDPKADIHEFSILHPADPSSPQKIKIQFPGKTGQILLRMGWILGANILLLILISGAFIFAFTIIMRQKKIQQIRRDFISNLTHEFKTPVSTISLALEGLLNYDVGNNPEKNRQFLTMAFKENKRLGLMIEKTLNMAALENGRIFIKPAPTDIHAIIRETADNFEVHVRHRNGAIRLFLNAGKSLIPGDHDHLVQVFYNLLDNANKYSHSIPEISVSTMDSNDGNYVEISLSDNGSGIPPEHLNDIFKPFIRLNEQKSSQVKGFGLGLAYVHKVIELHNGTITVTSREDEGTNFIIKLPVR